MTALRHLLVFSWFLASICQADSQPGQWTMAFGSGSASIRADNASTAIRVEGDGHSGYLGYCWPMTERIHGLASLNYSRLLNVDEVNDSLVGAELGLKMELPAAGLPGSPYLKSTVGWHYADGLARHGAAVMVGAGLPLLVWRQASVDLEYQYRYINWRNRDGYNELRSQLSQVFVSAQWRY